MCAKCSAPFSTQLSLTKTSHNGVKLSSLKNTKFVATHTTPNNSSSLPMLPTVNNFDVGQKLDAIGAHFAARISAPNE